MIEWKEIKNEMPPIGEEILYAIPEYRGDKGYVFEVKLASISHPYLRDNMYNPKYFLVYYMKELSDSVQIKSEQMKDYHFWAPINNPIIENNKGKA